MRGGGGLLELNLAGNEMTRSLPSSIFWATFLNMSDHHQQELIHGAIKWPPLLFLGANASFVHLCIWFVNAVQYVNREQNNFSTWIKARWAPAGGPWVDSFAVSAFVGDVLVELANTSVFLLATLWPLSHCYHFYFCLCLLLILILSPLLLKHLFCCFGGKFGLSLKQHSWEQSISHLESMFPLFKFLSLLPYHIQDITIFRHVCLYIIFISGTSLRTRYPAQQSMQLHIIFFMVSRKIFENKFQHSFVLHLLFVFHRTTNNIL